MNRQFYFFRRIGFGDEIKRTGLDCSYDQLGIVLMADDNDRRVRRQLLQGFKNLSQAGAIVQQIKDNGTKRLFYQAAPG